MNLFWVVVSDLHYPDYHKPTWEAVMDFIRRNRERIGGFVFLGDQFNFDSISHHNEGKPLYQPPESYTRDIRAFEKNILTKLEPALPEKAPRVWMLGNHERWERDFIEKFPALAGALDHTQLLRLVERGWQVVPLGGIYKIGRLYLTHGDNFRGKYPAARAVEALCANVLMGHHHSPQQFTKTAFRPEDRWCGWVAPAACNLRPRYVGNNPTGWLNGFVVVEICPPRLDFSVHQLITLRGRVLFGGEWYGSGSSRP